MFFIGNSYLCIFFQRFCLIKYPALVRLEKCFKLLSFDYLKNAARLYRRIALQVGKTPGRSCKALAILLNCLYFINYPSCFWTASVFGCTISVYGCTISDLGCTISVYECTISVYGCTVSHGATSFGSAPPGLNMYKRKRLW